MNDYIYMKNCDLLTSTPNEPASDPNYVKHVHCDGARFHVISRSTQGAHCSFKNCIINKPKGIK